MNKKAVILGASAGCLGALSQILPALPEDYPFPILVVVHLPADKDSLIGDLLDQKCALHVHEVDDKEPLVPGHVYFAPPNYHMLIEKEEIAALSVEDEVLYSRPSIDVSFQSAADVFRERLTGIILTGANNDGAAGLAAVVAAGGTAIVQNPEEAFADAMPQAALFACPDARVMNLSEITAYLKTLQGTHV
jgi:two-component system chemotaxis response regulator CheB